MLLFFFLMIRRPPRSTLDRSSAASDVYKRQITITVEQVENEAVLRVKDTGVGIAPDLLPHVFDPVSYTHLRAHETVLDLVCRLLLEKKKNTTVTTASH